MDFGDDRFSVQPNIKEKFVLRGLGNFGNWIHIKRLTEQNVDETKCWQITWEAGNYLAYLVNKERDTIGIIWITSKEELINHTGSSWDCSLNSGYIVKVQTVEKMVGGSIWGALQSCYGPCCKQGRIF